MEREYTIFCDESDKSGKYFSNFYGGVIVGGSRLDAVNQRLLAVREAAGIKSEVKWEKVSPYDLESYKILISAYFDEIERGFLRTRIMFRQNAYIATGLSTEHRQSEYYLLYYQFLKHGFGFAQMPRHPEGPNIRIYLDKLPSQSKERVAKFRGHLMALAENSYLRHTGLSLKSENIAEVDSKKHILLQCTDVVLGSMSFRLNDKHKVIPDGSKRRGKRTIAKEKLYKFILSEIKRVTGKTGFNPGISTGVSRSNWDDPYLHWNFKPRSHSFDSSRTKNK